MLLPIKIFLNQHKTENFGEDLYYRLSTVPIRVPSLRDRKEDITLLFRKFVVDFAERYKTTPVQLEDEAKNLLINYPWPGNVRELKNIAEQISVLSTDNVVTANELRKFLPEKNIIVCLCSQLLHSSLPVIFQMSGKYYTNFFRHEEGCN